MNSFSACWIALALIGGVAISAIIAYRLRDGSELDKGWCAAGTGFLTLVLLCIIAVPATTYVPTAGVALRDDDASCINHTRCGRAVWGPATVMDRSTSSVKVTASYSTASSRYNARRVNYSVNVEVPTPEACLRILQHRRNAGFTLLETIHGLLWQMQEEKHTEMEGFNNPADQSEQRRFCMMVGDWLSPRLPDGAVFKKAEYAIYEPIAYQPAVSN